jgi:hypothetical protein
VYTTGQNTFTSDLSRFFLGEHHAHLNKSANQSTAAWQREEKSAAESKEIGLTSTSSERFSPLQDLIIEPANAPIYAPESHFFPHTSRSTSEKTKLLAGKRGMPALGLSCAFTSADFGLGGRKAVFFFHFSIPS